MTTLVLDGLRATPLAGYLSSLGLLRAVSRLSDPEATGHWQRRRFVLGSHYGSVDELADDLYTRFEPEAIVSPWNRGSGFSVTDKRPTAKKAVQWVRDGDDPRLARLRAAVTAADEVAERGHSLGWGNPGTDLWEWRKNDVFRLCRNVFPDDALPWLDAAVTLGHDVDPAFSRLLGTGGNFGSQDLSVTYIQNVATVFSKRDAAAWLASALDGREVALPGALLGQYAPETIGNPWTFLLLVEGALLFATAVARRHGAGHSHAALPFQVRGSAAGFASAAEGERALAELWAPEWTQPATLAEIRHLLGEGRAEWNQRPSRSGLDFVRAVASLGVDRGVDAFTRHVFVDRLGQSPIAVPAGRVEVPRRAVGGLLTDLDAWTDALRATTVPAAVAARLRALDQAVFDHARRGNAAELAEVFAALGRCHEAVAQSGAARAKARPLVLRHGVDLFTTLRPAAEEAELRVALALATARDATAVPTLGGLRALLCPLAGDPKGRRPEWASAPRQVTLAAGQSAALAEAARRRAFPGEVAELNEAYEPAVRGARMAFEHGASVASGDVAAFVAGDLDAERLRDLLAGLLCVDWGELGDRHLPGPAAQPDPALDLLLPFTAPRTVRAGPADLVLRPGFDWPARLAAGHAAEVLIDAARRLRIGGARHVITPVGTAADGTRLAGALLLRVTAEERCSALARVGVLDDTDFTTPEEEIPA